MDGRGLHFIREGRVFTDTSLLDYHYHHLYTTTNHPTMPKVSHYPGYQVIFSALTPSPTPQSFHKVVYKADIHSTDLYQVIIADADTYKKWKAGDKTIPLADVVDSFQIFHTGQGAQGIMGHPSKQQLENDFGSHKDTDVVLQILEKGEMQAASNKDGYSTTNDSKHGGNTVSAGAHSGGGHGGR